MTEKQTTGDHPRRGRARVLITGATGFIGSHLCDTMLDAGYAVRVVGRRSATWLGSRVEEILVPDLADAKAIRNAFAGIDAVIHAAGLAHVTRASGDPLEEYRRSNVESTRQLAQAAFDSDVRAFVLISSAAALEAQSPGENPDQQRRFAYAQSKRESENVVAALLGTTPVRPVILRAPMVYGPRMKGNPLRLLRLVARGLPLPFSSIANRRSSLYVLNLTAAARFAIENPQIRGTFHVTDGPPLSTPQFVRLCAKSLSVQLRLFPVPVALLGQLGRLGDVVNRVVRIPVSTEMLERLTGSMELDTTGERHLTGFEPPFTPGEGMKATAEWFQRHHAE